MKVTDYEKQFDEILEGTNNPYPYDSEEYLHYVKMNKARIKRWTKKGKILPSLEAIITSIKQPMNWLLITEPWCGDAANGHAFFVKLAALNPNITLTIQNRDATDSEIDNYLTNGGKSIPKLVVRDADGKDFFDWGPRPTEAQAIVNEQKLRGDISLRERMEEIQLWYNKDKGVSTQEELEVLFSKVLSPINTL